MFRALRGTREIRKSEQVSLLLFAKQSFRHKEMGRIRLSRKIQYVENSMYNTSNNVTPNCSMYCTSSVI